MKYQKTIGQQSIMTGDLVVPRDDWGMKVLVDDRWLDLFPDEYSIVIDTWVEGEEKGHLDVPNGMLQWDLLILHRSRLAYAFSFAAFKKVA